MLVNNNYIGIHDNGVSKFAFGHGYIYLKHFIFIVEFILNVQNVLIFD